MPESFRNQFCANLIAILCHIPKTGPVSAQKFFYRKTADFRFRLDISVRDDILKTDWYFNL
jgi:hypothetical protein